MGGEEEKCVYVCKEKGRRERERVCTSAHERAMHEHWVNNTDLHFVVANFKTLPNSGFTEM